MLNVISRSIVSSHTRGPRKVVLNLLKGLDALGYPYTVNGAPDSTKTLWIHDDPEALLAAMKLPRDVAILAGPNIYTMPKELPEAVDTSLVTWLHPAPWVKNFWQISSARNIPSLVWPVGIDTKEFSPDLETKKDLILVYNKQRLKVDISAVTSALEALNEKFSVITYGNYHESDYQRLLGRAKAVIWVGRSESQGIGLLEALAMDVPALVWEVKKFGQWTGGGHELFSPTELAFASALTAPYFDSRCGLKFTDHSELGSKLNEFLTSLNEFKPRRYILENLSLETQAEAFMNIYRTHLGQNQLSLKDKTLTTKEKWQNGQLYFQLKTRLKDAVRSIIR